MPHATRSSTLQPTASASGRRKPVGRGLRWGVLAVGATAALIAVPAPRARACGGFFCNQSQDPSNLPVAQTAENVLFAMKRTPSGQFQLEAHVQIFYTGPADKFSWIVPVDSQPEVAVGNNALFNALLSRTRPQFALDWSVEGTCRALPMNGAGNTFPAGGLPTPGPSTSVADAGAGPPGVDIAFRGEVGPYGAAVIKSTDPQDAKPVIDWLNSNQYFVTSEGARLIADYVRQEKYFVAIKLLPQKGINEILPLVMRFVGPGPCIPLKLTAIAALKDLKINLWVLADQRVVPDNVYEMEINPARIDWLAGGANYDDLVKRAADEAGGNAFITEYAGPTTMFKEQLYRPGAYNLTSIRMAPTPPDALDQIGQQGFARDTSLLEVLRRHIPMPDGLKAMGLDERTFYNQLRSIWMQYQGMFAPFDAGMLADDLDKTLIAPLRNDQLLLDSYPRLTRLSTFISPEEMTIDPTFTMNSSLPDVPLVRRAKAVRVCGQEQYDICNAPVRLELPDGQSVWMTPQKQDAPCYYGPPGYERGTLDALPALWRGWSRSSAGEGIATLDNEAKIRAAVMARNLTLAAAAGAAPVGITPNGGTGGRGAGTGGAAGAGGVGGAGATPIRTASGGCSCAVSSGGPSAAALLPLLLGCLRLAARRRRRN
jgi:hypothetical protein